MVSLSSLVSILLYYINYGFSIFSSINYPLSAIPQTKTHGAFNYSSCGSGESFDGNNSSLWPDVFHCEAAKTLGGRVDCCPPKFEEIFDFILPLNPPLRIRPAAHLLNATQIAELELGIKMMKSLDENDPLNFYNQAKVHCAYCNAAYKQLGICTSDPKPDFLIHRNALFFPFHRAYLYFFERIMQKLIGNPNFSLPFWNWDSPIGMYMPKFFDQPNSSLYDDVRDPRHDSTKLVFLNYDGVTEDYRFNVVDCNLRWMNEQMNVGARRFLGRVIKLGETPEKEDMGTIELSPHNTLHTWLGVETPFFEDMGNFYSAARDPIFSSHHGNLDRLWNIWQSMEDQPRDHTDPAWLNSTFVFYDENRQAVRVKVSDILDSKKLGYVYQDVDIPWLHTKKIPTPNSQLRTRRSESLPIFVDFPRILNSDTTTMVDRPEVQRNGLEDEVLVIEDVEYDPTTPIHFNVLVNVDDYYGDGEEVCPGNLEFLGSFKNIPLGLYRHNKTTSLSFVITQVIQGLGLERHKNLAVRIQPKVGGESVTIGGIKIQLHSSVE